MEQFIEALDKINVKHVLKKCADVFFYMCIYEYIISDPSGFYGSYSLRVWKEKQLSFIQTEQNMNLLQMLIFL